MKKLTSILLSAAMLLSLAACGGQTDSSPTPNAGGGSGEEEPTTVTVTGRDSLGADIQVEVPYQPKRVVVLDLANLDILDNLGLGDCIVGEIGRAHV